MVVSQQGGKEQWWKHVMTFTASTHNCLQLLRTGICHIFLHSTGQCKSTAKPDIKGAEMYFPPLGSIGRGSKYSQQFFYYVQLANVWYVITFWCSVQ